MFISLKPGIAQIFGVPQLARYNLTSTSIKCNDSQNVELDIRRQERHFVELFSTRSQNRTQQSLYYSRFDNNSSQIGHRTCFRFLFLCLRSNKINNSVSSSVSVRTDCQKRRSSATSSPRIKNKNVACPRRCRCQLTVSPLRFPLSLKSVANRQCDKALTNQCIYT